MSDPTAAAADPRAGLLALYDVALPQVYGYLLARCGRRAVADALRARDTLDTLGAHHRAVLTLRYCDDLPVREVAALLDRTEHATEALLVRARAAFRRAYDRSEGP